VHGIDCKDEQDRCSAYPQTFKLIAAHPSNLSRTFAPFNCR
jgi:hypothetical protein